MDPEEQAAKAAFAFAMIPVDVLLPAAIEWIADNLEPGAVFDSEKLRAWALAAGYQLIQ